MAVEPRCGVTVGPGGGRGVSRREEPVLGVPLARALAGGRPAEMLDAVQDEIDKLIADNGNISNAELRSKLKQALQRELTKPRRHVAQSCASLVVPANIRPC